MADSTETIHSMSKLEAKGMEIVRDLQEDGLTVGQAREVLDEARWLINILVSATKLKGAGHREDYFHVDSTP